jgi:hypothetical protein
MCVCVCVCMCERMCVLACVYKGIHTSHTYSNGDYKTVRYHIVPMSLGNAVLLYIRMLWFVFVCTRLHTDKTYIACTDSNGDHKSQIQIYKSTNSKVDHKSQITNSNGDHNICAGTLCQYLKNHVCIHAYLWAS